MLEGFLLYLDIRYLAVGRNQLVQFLEVRFHDRLYLLERHALRQCLIREDEGH